jgi:uncharacterized glyoxalase superfamily protein PhnB
MAARLCTRLATMAAELARQDSPSPEQMLSTVEEMTMMDSTIRGTTGLLMYDDVTDAHYARSVAASARIVCEPVDQSYGIREYGAADSEDQICYFQSPLD